MRRLKVHVLYEHAEDMKPYGSSYIRLLLPLEHPANHGSLEVSRGLEYQQADFLIIDRLWRPDISMTLVRDLVKRARRDGAAIVYSIDDNLLDLEPALPLRPWPSEEHKLVAAYLARRASRVLVSTETLKRRFEHLNDRIIVIPNAIDERLFFEPPLLNCRTAKSSKLTIGYMGTPSHDEDLLMIVQPLRELLRRMSSSRLGVPGVEVSFEIVGGVLDKGLLQLFDGLPVELRHVPNSEVEYPRFVPWMRRNLDWDIGIAPLVEDKFTSCKSDVKFLDYASLSVPGIYSNVNAYRGSVVHLETGYLVENTAQSWMDGFVQMIKDRQLRDRLASAARKYVFNERTLARSAKQWADALLCTV